MKHENKILLAFYGDDFTGSTDALEFICTAGLKSVLFIEPPTAQQLSKFSDLAAYGIAGRTRALAPGEMEKILVPAFGQMKANGARHVHYKVCSTFDSSPSTGSIGKAIDCGASVFSQTIIPVLGGMPALGRYCLFGNLFARMGIGSNGNVFRLDRHPSMNKHPVTPADESDLVLHLSKQTKRKFGSIDILKLDLPVKNWKDHLADHEAVLIDVLYESQLEKIGAWMELQAAENNFLFSVGTSAIEQALGSYWNAEKLFTPVTSWKIPGRAEPLLVISGSCSPVTSAQIEYARKENFKELELDAVSICNNNSLPQVLINFTEDQLRLKKNLIIHTGNKNEQNLSPEKLGSALGMLAKYSVERGLVKRVLIAGGDTSSYAARAMEIDGVEMIAPLVKGAPLCRVFSDNKKIHGLEVNIKGGQVGAEDYFIRVLNGT